MIPPVVPAAPGDVDALLELDYHLRRATALLGTLRSAVAVARRRLSAERADVLADGPELARRRHALALTQRELAQEAHISRAYLAALETGHRAGPQIVRHVHRTIDALASQEGAA